MSIIDKARWKKLEFHDIPAEAWPGIGLRIARDSRGFIYRARVFPTANGKYFADVWDFEAVDWLALNTFDTKREAMDTARALAKMQEAIADE